MFQKPFKEKLYSLEHFSSIKCCHASSTSKLHAKAFLKLIQAFVFSLLFIQKYLVVLYLSTITNKTEANLIIEQSNVYYLGIHQNQKDYKCYSLIIKKIYNSMDVTLFENKPYYPKSDIQWEHTTQKYQFWEIKITPNNFQTSCS